MTDEVHGNGPIDVGRRGSWAPVRLLLSIAAIVFTVDLGTKTLAVAFLTGYSLPLFGSAVTCTVVRSTPPSWLVDDTNTWMLTVAEAAVAVSILWWGRRLQSRWWAAGLGTLLGGAVGNLVDRVFREPGLLRGGVIDFVAIDRLPTFNVADAAIVGSAILLVAISFSREGLDEPCLD